MFARKIQTAVVLAVLVLMGGAAEATNYFVDPDGDNSTGLSWATAFHTIQQGLNAAGATIVEANEGTYVENVDFNGVSCTLTSTDPNDWDVVAATVINGNSVYSYVVTCDSGEDENSVLRGFTIKNGTNRGLHLANASPTVTKCIIEDNGAFGIWAFNSTSHIDNCLIRENSSFGISCSQASMKIENNKIYDNGGGILIVYSSTPEVMNNWVYNNSGYGVDVNSSGVVKLCNNTIVKNNNYGVRKYGSAAAPIIINCIIWGHYDDLIDCNATYSCIEDANSGEGNLSSDPAFMDNDLNDFHLTSDSPCINAGDLDGSYGGQTDIDGQDRVQGAIVDIGADETDWGEYAPYDGMEIVSAEKDANGVITVITTGAVYVLDSNGIEMYRRIDPATNEVDDANDGKGRQVADLSFNSNIGTLAVGSNDGNVAVISSSKAIFEFHSDSLFFILAKESFTYDHNNLINDVPWNAPFDEDKRDLDRMWTDGYGGSLHAKVSGEPVATAVNTDSTTISMTSGDRMAHMVFPPKKFDFENLYGTGAKPHVFHIGSRSFIDELCEPNAMDTYEANDFGVFELEGAIYDNPNDYSHIPLYLEEESIMGYDVNDPCATRFITAAHANDFKVITYLTSPSLERWIYPNDCNHPRAGKHQDISVTLKMMRDLQSEYNLDGWYFDNAGAGGFLADYDFIRRVRTDIGNNGIIYHHDSADIWAGQTSASVYSGLKAIFVDAYANYTLNGENGEIAEIDEPNDIYLRYHTSGYGMSQTYGEHIRRCRDYDGSVLHKMVILSEEEVGRLLGENLNGNGCFVSRTEYYAWLSHFKPAFDARKAEYQADPNIVDVNWPVNEENGWFRAPSNINITDITCDSISISWETDLNSDSHVACDSDGVWWEYNFTAEEFLLASDRNEYNPNLVTNHSITVSGLEPATTYEFMIRSKNNDTNIPGEIIWGDIGSFTTECGVRNLDKGLCYCTIQSALNDANNGDEIVVYTGTYYENIDFGGKAVMIRSVDPNDWEVVEATIIDGNQEGSVVVFDSNEGPNSVICGLTITNGRGNFDGEWYVGCGIYCESSSPTIKNCVITKNGASSGNLDGGGIACYYGGSPVISNCIISDNKAKYIGGIDIYDVDGATIENCIIHNNRANLESGGIWCWGDGVNIINCTITQNLGEYGGGMLSTYGSPAVTNCIFWGNDASVDGNEIYVSYTGGAPLVSYCDIKGGIEGPGVYGDCNDGGGNIDSDPCFVDVDSNDFHLCSNSPCINMGDPNRSYAGQTDIDNGSRVLDSRVDIGADERADIIAPIPNPMTWATVPYATGPNSIAMTATTATDISGVEYYFECTLGGGHNSGWQDGTSYTDTGLSQITQYCYRVQARDKSDNQNTTGWSTTQCATTPDTTLPSPNPMTWATVPYATGPYSIAMVATTATDISGVEYYFDCTTTGGHDSGWQESTSYTDTGLSPDMQYTYRVKARDKSSNQNEGGWSDSRSATTPWDFLIENKTFEVNWPPPGWEETQNSEWNKESDRAYDGSYSADFDGSNQGGGKAGNLTTPALDCNNASTISIEFYAYSEGADDGDYYIDYYDKNGTWNQIQRLDNVGVGSWSQYSDTVTNSNYMHSGFKVRWRVVQLKNDEHVYVDLVTIKKK